MFLIISDLTIVEYSNAAICEQATPAPAMLCTNNSATITHPNPGYKWWITHFLAMLDLQG